MKKKKPGFTLMEVIIALGITVVVLGIVSSMFITGNRVFSDSDVKSTLQIEAQTVQEKISNIGMQGTEVLSISPNIRVGEVNSLIIKSYVKEDDDPRYFKIQRSGSRLTIDRCKDASCNDVENNQILSENLESLSIDYNNTAKSIEFDITLSRHRGYSDVEYPVNFKIGFRNKGN